MAKEKHNTQSVENEILMQGRDPESYDHASPETDGLTGQDPVGASLDNIEDQRADEAEQAPRSEDSQEEAAETPLEETEDAARDFQKEAGESEEEADEPEEETEKSAGDPEEISGDDKDAAAQELVDDDDDLDSNDDSTQTAESAPVSEAEIPASGKTSSGESEQEEDESAEPSDDDAAARPADVKSDSEEKPTVAAYVTAAEKKKSTSLYKLAFSAIIFCTFIIVLSAYTNQFSFFKKNTTMQAAVPPPEPDPAEPAHQINATKKNDPYAQYRSKLGEAATLRGSILMKQQEIERLKAHYAEGIQKLENDILVEMLDYNLADYEQTLENKRLELDLKTIQRRQAYIQKLDDPIKWLELGSEELLFLKRRAAIDLQMIEIAGGIDMDMHMRNIDAAIQKYQLTADNLAIDTDKAEMESPETIWQRLYLKTKSNPSLRAELNNWYIQQEVCSGDLSRIGELSEITTETARCLAEIDAAGLFLRNITELSPTVARYVCQWNGKWLCLNGVKALSPSVAEYLFQWNGEWISLNGLSEFPPDRAKHLLQWQGKQLELMGLQENIKKTDHLTLKYLVEWESAGGKLYVPQHIRNLMDQL